jgi:hypothetical protein
LFLLLLIGVARIRLEEEGAPAAAPAPVGLAGCRMRSIDL